MNKITLLLIFSLSLLGFSQSDKKKVVFGEQIETSPNGYIRCATDEYERYLKKIYPKRATTEEFETWLAPLIQNYKHLQTVSSQSGGIIYIPVVVHVIHNGDAYGTNENITDEQVQSQITVMTQDYRKMINTPGYNTNPVGADTQIEFVLAKVDPNGNPTNGIDRVNLCQNSWSDTDIDGIVKPSTIWDPTQYMNMWSVNFSDSTLLGYAQFPDASGLAGLSASGGAANTDGVVAGYKYFGSSDLSSGAFQAPFDKGRTMTHEVGHFLGLRHIWGDSSSCPSTNVSTNKDYCADTPAAAAANYDCPTGTDSCPSTPGVDMIENYMDYTDDACMNIFTQNQKDRITVIMNNAPRRASLKTSTKDVAIALFANDAEVKIENLCEAVSPSCANPNGSLPNKIISLYNRGTSNLTSATISYNINGGTNLTQNWTGSLAPNKFAYVTLANSSANGTFNVSITSVNGTSDQRASNNTASKAFNFTISPVAYANATTFTFNLVGDRYGAETTWNLKNQAGTILYYGGPYTNLTSNTTQNLVTNQSWALSANGCYYLTVNDSYGDGIVSGYGNGYYTVTANSGANVLVNVTDFTGPGGNSPISRISYFTNNANLSTENFEFASNIYVYPNPSKNEINISLPDGLAIPNSISITNSLGQTILSNKALNNNLTINTSSLSNGVYFITIFSDKYTKTLRFIKE